MNTKLSSDSPVYKAICEWVSTYTDYDINRICVCKVSEEWCRLQWWCYDSCEDEDCECLTDDCRIPTDTVPEYVVRTLETEPEGRICNGIYNIHGWNIPFDYVDGCIVPWDETNVVGMSGMAYTDMVRDISDMGTDMKKAIDWVWGLPTDGEIWV